ncbi:hypothetical protein [Streptomyces sp. MI02-7b]|uniref:hypothetical protein n=1 Tax=Streptomyces sp. MI02-7b TaxID=462941 RepID=UPI0029B538FA|nr:hypothetical protein [Streptomyces sp. MI02-7b]MDX3072618.1 hypothetical protein [Streptomyces sp. MI02-7b]
MSRRPLSCLLLALAGALVPAAAAAGADPPMLLDDVTQRPSVMPPTFEATNTAALVGLRWSHWGSPEATGRGTLRINTCEPNCAEGHVRVLPGSDLQVRGVRIDQGRHYYRQYRILNASFSPSDRAAYAHWTDTYTPRDFR